MKKKIIIYILLIILIITIITLLKKNSILKEELVSLRNVNVDENVEKDITNECSYEIFDPIYNESYDYFGEMLQDMIYQNNVYYKKINTYEEYLEYENKFSTILKMQEEDFSSYYYLISAIENTSMENLVVDTIIINDNILTITLTKDNSVITYNCIAYKIPQEYDTENIIIGKDEDLINNTASISSESLIPISEDEAIKIAENSTNIGNYILREIKQDTVSIYNKDTIVINNENFARDNEESVINKETLNKEAYVLYYSTEDYLDKMLIYIDLYTGENFYIYREGI